MLQAIFHNYCFDLRTEEGRVGWAELQAKLDGRRKFHAADNLQKGSTHYRIPELEGQIVTLDENDLFDNQWNATFNGRSYRVFDWAQHSPWSQDYEELRFSARGHWLEFLFDVDKLRSEWHVCGYCGHRVLNPTSTFHTGCLGSLYMRAESLGLTRMMPLNNCRDRPDLAPDELAYLTERYVEAQRVAGRQLAQKKASEGIKEAEQRLVDAEQMRKGWQWIADNPINADNLICYTHRGVRFAWGAFARMSPEVAAAVAKTLVDGNFPAKYEIQLDDDTKIEGGPHG